MGKILNVSDYQVKIIDEEEPAASPAPEAGYVICRRKVLDCEEIFRLEQQGFRFHDRCFFMTADLRSIDLGYDVKGLNGITFTADQEYEAAVYDLAHQVYVTDRRFHLDPVFHQPEACRVMDAYIEDCKADGCLIYKAYHDDLLLGYAIVNHDADPKKQYFENVLGVTRPGIQGKMIASPLYRYMMKKESENFRRYAGRVSTSNLSSVNLHYQLGAKVSRIYSEYIFCNMAPLSEKKGK